MSVTTGRYLSGNYCSFIHAATSFKIGTRQFARTVVRRKKPVPKFQKALNVVIMGPPNAGKSVLLNTLIKEKVAATSRKRHTTRGEILGVFNHRNTQLVYYDTPGFVSKNEAVSTAMKQLRGFTESSTEKADVVLLVVDAARSSGDRFHSLFAEMARLALQNAKKELILVLNKVDVVEPKLALLETTRELVSLINGVKLGEENAHLAALDTTTFMVSALKNDGVLDITNYLITIADEKPWVIPKEFGITTLSKEERVEQIILEMLMENVHEEIPYSAEIYCNPVPAFTDKLRIDVDIIVDNPGQQKILIGQQGRTLVKIRQGAVAILEKLFDTRILLFLWIKLKKDNNAALSL